MSNDADSSASPIFHLRTNTLSPFPDGEPSIASPARGRETRTALLQKLRPPPLVHAWDCWIERPPERSGAERSISNGRSVSNASAPSDVSSDYAPHITHLISVLDVRTFWSLFNNLPLSSLPLRYACHLFHRGVRPLWEDPRNYRGGAWKFRVSRTTAPALFTELCLLAIGEQLQNAVEEKDRTKFRDDICGVTFSPRNAAIVVISVWNRDAENEDGKQRLLQTVLEGVGKELRPREGSWDYKRHDEHERFNASVSTSQFDHERPPSTTTLTDLSSEISSADAESTVEQIDVDARTVRKILADLNISRKVNPEIASKHSSNSVT